MKATSKAVEVQSQMSCTTLESRWCCLYKMSNTVSAALTPAELDAILVGLEAGLDLALQRAKAWSGYIRNIITYIEKKSQLGKGVCV